MKSHHRIAACFLILSAAFAARGETPGNPAPARPFNWKLLDGAWSESAGHQFACSADNAVYRIVVAPDKSRVTFRFDRPVELVGGKAVKEFGAEVRRADGNSLVLKYGPENSFMAAGEWELRFIGPGTYRMGHDAWGKEKYNNIFGIKCGA